MASPALTVSNNLFEMNWIKSLSDIVVFSGSIVAFEENDAFPWTKTQFNLIPNSTLKFARIDSVRERMYGVHINLLHDQIIGQMELVRKVERLLGIEEVPKKYAFLSDTSLRVHEFYMRWAFPEEVRAIAKAIISKKAKIEYPFDPKTIERLFHSQLYLYDSHHKPNNPSFKLEREYFELSRSFILNQILSLLGGEPVLLVLDYLQ